MGISASQPSYPLLNKLANALREVRAAGNEVTVPYIAEEGLGQMLLGATPEEIENWAYGNSPFTTGYPGLSNRGPAVKRGRGESLADTVFAGMDATAVGPALRGARTVGVGALNRLFENTLPSGVRQAGAIKPRGGNWLPEIKNYSEQWSTLPEGQRKTLDEDGWAKFVDHMKLYMDE